METSEAMTICEEEERLFEEWRRRRKPFVSDGVVSENDYQTSSPKIAFILKEVNDPNGGGWDLRKFLREGGCEQTWDEVTRWVHGIRSLPGKHEWSFYGEITEDFRKKTLKSIVAMNLKKSPGGSSTDLQALKAVAKEDAPYIKRQYAIYDPDITICGGDSTAEIFKEVVGHKMEWQKTKSIGAQGDEIWWYKRNDEKKKPKVVVSYWHPAYWCRTSEDLLSILLDAIDEIIRSQTDNKGTSDLL